MRFLAFLFVTGLLAAVGCAGDSSSVMSVWNDSGVGGNAGQPPAGGAGGGGGDGSGTIIVAGGVRDLATAQCISTSGGGCLFSADDLACIKGNCAQELSACYSQPGISTSAAGGACLDFANCLLKCPCDRSQSTCETGCQKYAYTNTCGMCIVSLGTCASTHNCPQTQTCGAGLGMP
jgi:hypothetical protein